MSVKTVIIIPARYHSSRFPGKPLAMIAGKTMVERVYEIAVSAIRDEDNCDILVATDDDRIVEHCQTFQAKAVLTSQECRSGSDRALNACESLSYTPDIVINLQGDTPLTPPPFISEIINCLKSTSADVATPVTQLSWGELDNIRERKKLTPFSGTTAIVNSNYDALWFSKQIIPAIRDEEKLRKNNTLSPVFRHIGLYGFKYSALKSFISLPMGYYESLECLEQLRFIENGFRIKAVPVNYGNRPQMSGVDTEADLKLCERLINNLSEPAR